MNQTAEENKATDMDYASFTKMQFQQVENPDFLDENQRRHYDNRKLNLQRTKKWEKTFFPSPELQEIVRSISSYRKWMIITETWCGDSAQILPVIAKTALLNEKIDLRIVLRDDNPEIMERYLTNGSRSIPKLVVFNQNGTEIFQWGPRPAEAQKLVQKLKENGFEKPGIQKELHLWYAKNRGQEIEKELINLLRISEISAS